jgi:hypothetical protein
MVKRTTQIRKSKSKSNMIFAGRFARGRPAPARCHTAPLQVDSFDYSRLSGSIAKFLRNQADRINQTSSRSVIQIGKDLIAAKRYLAHGEFVTWVKCEAGLPARTAQAYMQVANWAAHKSPSVTRLPPSVLYVISARSAPEQFVQQLLERVEAGEQISARTVRQEIKSIRGSASADGPVAAVEALDDAPNYDVSIARAVDILVYGLSPANFIRVKEIMTSSIVIEDPQLAHNIVVAFLNAAKRMQEYDEPHGEILLPSGSMLAMTLATDSSRRPCIAGSRLGDRVGSEEFGNGG